MMVECLKKNGFTKDEIQRNVDFAFLTEEEQDAEINKKIENFSDKIIKELKKHMEGDK